MQRPPALNERFEALRFLAMLLGIDVERYRRVKREPYQYELFPQPETPSERARDLARP